MRGACFSMRQNLLKPQFRGDNSLHGFQFFRKLFFAFNSSIPNKFPNKLIRYMLDQKLYISLCESDI